MRASLRIAGLSAGLCALLALPAAAILGGGELSPEKEIEMTAAVHEQIRAQAPLVTDPVLIELLYRIGERVVAQLEPQPFVYRFFLIDDDALNAFTIGGGYVYINAGVLASAGSVDELAGVIAHEIAHVNERHVARRAEGSGGITLLATLAGIAAVAAGADPTVLVISQGINQALRIQHTRAHENEADRSGISYMMRTGFDPEGMTHFFQRILEAYPARDGPEIPAYLYTHPALEERVAAARVEIGRLERERAALGLAPVERTPPEDVLPAGTGLGPPSDAELRAAQERLTRLSSVVAGTRPALREPFDPQRAQAKLDAAERARKQGDEKLALGLLDEAAGLEPSDPRVHLMRADIAEARGDDEAAVAALERAWRLDRGTPLVSYRLGLLHTRLGQRTRAVFFLEQVLGTVRRGSKLRERAQIALQQVEFPVFSTSGLDPAQPAIPAGERIAWRGELSRRFMAHNPVVEIRFVTPDGSTAHTQSVRMSPLGRVGASYAIPAESGPGDWRVEVRIGELLVEQRKFRVARPRG